MKFLNAIKALPEPKEEDISDLDKAVLIEAARFFLDSGGVVTLDDWRDMTSVERVVFSEAAEHHRMKVAGTIGLACNSIEYAADLFRPYDGGAVKVGIVLNEVLDRKFGK